METDDRPAPSLLDALAGTWMPKDYCECLRRERSAYACRAFADEVYVMMVRRSEGDSLIWSYITTHEGGPEERMAYEASSRSFLFQPSADQRWMPSARLRSIDADHAELWLGEAEGRIFRRVRSEEEELNSALLAGTYRRSPGDAIVRLRADGMLDGLDGRSRFNILTDFTEGFDTLDIVFLHNGGYDWRNDAFHYRWDGAELLLTRMDTTADPYVYRFGPLRYRLLTDKR